MTSSLYSATATILAIKEVSYLVWVDAGGRSGALCRSCLEQDAAGRHTVEICWYSRGWSGASVLQNLHKQRRGI